MRRLTAFMVFRAAALGFVFALGGVLGQWSPAADAAESAAVENREVAKHLAEAQKLSNRKQWNAALAALEKAEAVPKKSPYAEYKIDQFRAYVLTQQKKYSEAAAAFEQLAKSKQASAAERNSHWKTAAQLHYQVREYQRAAAAARAALGQRPDDLELRELLGQAEYLAGDFKNAAATLRQLVSSAEKRGSRPEESWLQTLLSAYDRLQDRANANAVWEMLLRHYPKPDYWRAVLSTRTAGWHHPTIELGYQRLRFDLGLLTDPADFENLAMGAIDAGAPGEAVQVLQAGLQQKIFTDRDAARFRRMLDYAEQEAAKRRAQLDELTRNAERASTGELSIALGRLHLGDGRYKEAAAALRQGFKKGSLSNPEASRIDLGIALLKNRQPEAARRVFDAVSDKSEWHDLAQLWSMRAQG